LKDKRDSSRRSSAYLAQIELENRRKSIKMVLQALSQQHLF